MKSINLILGNHNHQPVGNFDFVIENTYQNAYKPFLDMFRKYKDLVFTFHYSGSLIDWMEKHHPEHMDDLAALAKDGRIEMVSGGYYEPILPVIPHRDKVAQMRMLNEYIERRFGQKPKGAWIAERVWEPHLALPIVEADLSYIVVDDTHFTAAGLDATELFGYYTTDEDDARINIFPISKLLRYVIPFKPVKEIIEFIDSLATESGDRLLVLHDDGEKYGDWPDTYEWIYTRDWLKRFFDALSSEKWIKLTTYSEYMKKTPPVSRIYLPTSSYQEMGEWVLPAKPQRALSKARHAFAENTDVEPFLRGSFWRNYFVKYPESNNMHKRMLYASRMVEAMKGNTRDEARKELFMGQCNCPYWHGTFGGLYLNHLRYANYSHIIKATRLAEEAKNGASWLTAEESDFDLDGHTEIIVSNPVHSLFFHRIGGSLIEWDYKPDPINLIDTLARREEAYHEEILHPRAPAGGSQEGTKTIHEMQKKFDPSVRDLLVFDRDRRTMFIDRFFRHIPSAAEFRDGAARDIGSFASALYDMSVERSRDAIRLTLSAVGMVEGKPVAIEKKVECLQGGAMNVQYTFRNNGSAAVAAVFASECNATLLAPDAEDRYYFSMKGGKRERLDDGWKMNSTGEYRGTALGVADEGYKNIAITWTAREAIDFLRSPVITVSDAVDHFESAYQNSSIALLKPLSIPAGKSASFSFSVTVAAL
ncbi:MAG: alpha-amylase/4-alpha-glucanotransferase domain-containing protein [Spirochaetota bacterium]